VEISRIIEECAEYILTFGNFNFIMSDGEHLFCFGDNSLYFVERKFGDNSITLSDSDYKINVSDMKKIGEKAIIVATKPLTKEENWKGISGLMVFKDGKEVIR
jgi:glutamine amidotransferase